jgi:DNA modification methylase
MTTPAPWLPHAIAYRNPADLKRSPTNARTHDKKQIAALAESITRFGFPVPILIDAAGTIIAGHGRHLAAQKLKLQQVPCIVADHLTDDQRRAYTLADNQLAALSDWDDTMLAAELRALASSPIDLTGLGFDDLLKDLTPKEVTTEQKDHVPATPAGEPDSKPGQVYHLGPHRLMCGDSTKTEHIATLCQGDGKPGAALLHADPPYGMGKEADGVENDNLYHDKLDAFQLAWWRAWRPFIADNASAYVWGNPADLWRLWYSAVVGTHDNRDEILGLCNTERLTLRNEIVWDKDSAIGKESDTNRGYAPATERCLFFMLGEQGFNNNADNYWTGWEPLRAYLAGELAKMGWTVKDANRITGTQMGGHWFTTSQWCLITAEHYTKLQTAANGSAFARDHAALARDHAALARDHDRLKADFYATRAWFDNTHDSMTDVWRFPRVNGDDRHGHATPKPVDLIARAIKSSCPPGGLVLEPFGGSGTTLIAAADTGRVCRMMEIAPKWCDVIRRRWTAYAKAAGIPAGSGALE